jgi:hypothetical protein
MYEDSQYVEAGKGLPKLGKQVQTPDGIGRVDDLDVLGRRVRVSFMDRPSATFNADEVHALTPYATPTPVPVSVPTLNGRPLPEADIEGLADAAKDTDSSTHSPVAEHAEGSGEDPETEPQ